MGEGSTAESNVTIVPTWTAVMKRRKRSQSSVERFGLAAGSI